MRSTFKRSLWLTWAVVVAWVSGCGSDGRVDLLLDLRTDLVAGVEFLRIRTERFTQLPTEESVALATHVREVPALLSDGFAQGRRIAAFTDLTTGTHAIRIRLIGADNAVIVERIALVTLQKTSVFTVVITRDCRGVVCPTEDDASAIACLGGRCVRPECTEESLETCSLSSCTEATCTALAPCARASCTAGGVCLRVPDHEQCGTDQWCDPDLGCQQLETTMPVGGPRDGGPEPDASEIGDASCSQDGGCAPSDLSWGEWTAGLVLTDCPPAAELVVTTPTMELDTGTAIADPSQAGALLSLREALYIAANRDGPDTIVFDPSVFALDNAPVISLNGVASLPDQVETCIDGRGRGVVIDNPEMGDWVWTVGKGSYQVGLTFLNMSASQRVFGGRVAACRYGTDGKETFQLQGSTRFLEVFDAALVGPHNVFAVGTGVGADGGGAAISGNWFGIDPITRVDLSPGGLPALFAYTGARLPGVVRFQRNVVRNSFTVVAADSAMTVVLEGNFFGVDPSGRPLPVREGFLWSGAGRAVFGPGNVVFGTDTAIVFVSSNGTLQITRNSIHGNAGGIETLSTPRAPNPPFITSATVAGAGGTCDVSGTVELFSDRGDQGELFVASTACDSGAGWSYAGPLPSGRNLTATLTVGLSTSGFSMPVFVP